MERVPELQKRYLVVNFIGLVMVGTVFLYAVLVEVLKRWFEPFTGFGALPPSATDLLKYVFVFASFANYFLIRLILGRLAARAPQLLPPTAIMTFALAEMVAIFGLVLFLLTGNSFDFYLFFAFSLFLFYLFYPKYETWERLLSSQNQQPAGTPPDHPEG